MTKLDAVNYLLGILGTSPVGDLNNTHPDVGVAVAALENAITSVTSHGFWFNEVYNVTLSPDPGNGNKIDTTGYTKVISRTQYAIVRGNNLLFDPINNTYVFTKDQVVDGVAILTFEELPDAVQLAVQYYAAAQLCSTDLEDSQKLSEQQAFYQDAYVQLIKEDLEIKRRNAQRTPRVQDALYRVRPLRQARRYGPNFGGR